MNPRFAARLSSRGLVQVSGADSLRFLQDLVTNDVNAMHTSDGAAASATAFLNKRGRLLFGTIMLRAQENRYFLDIPVSKTALLVKHLTLYRLRANVDVDDVSDDYSVWSIVGSNFDGAARKQAAAHGFVFEDPRLTTLGHRAIVGSDFKGFDELPEAEEADFTKLRILNGVPDDTDFDDSPLPLDLALHLLNGVSFNKGCYLGQELIARSHFTGVLRKRVTPLAVIDDNMTVNKNIFDTPPPSTLISSRETLNLRRGARVVIRGKPKAGGKITSSVDNIGLAILKISDAFNGEQSSELSLEDGRRLLAWRPAWWATDSDAVTFED